MEYLSTRETAEKWGVSLRNVQRLLTQNRIPGAKKFGVSWLELHFLILAAAASFWSSW